MPPKQKPPAPIDRPLSKAYLREFAGWSTAFPPGLSEPNSLRVMKNVLITREGSARVRPGMRSYMRTKSPLPIVGTHEIFYSKNGKAYLVAVRESVDVGSSDEREIVSFRVIGPNDDGVIVMDTLEAFGFSVPSDSHALSFTSATTYVKYVQIDNKIFALSNAPEGMLMFWVGSEKKAKKLQSITRPGWNTTDKLIAMHPTSAWVSGNIPSSTRTNLCTNPDFEINAAGWAAATTTTQVWLSTGRTVGTHSLGGSSLPVRTNYATSPLHDVATTGTYGWGALRATLSVAGSSMRITKTVDAGTYCYAVTSQMKVAPGARMRVCYNLAGSASTKRLRTWVAFYRSNGDHISTLDVKNTDDLVVGRRVSSYFTIPTQATNIAVLIGLEPTTTTVNGRIDINNVCLSLDSDAWLQAPLDGNDGADFYWEGVVNASRSVYHPGRTIWWGSDLMPVVPGAYTVSADMWGTTGKSITIQACAFNASGTMTLNTVTSVTGTSAWARHNTTITVPSGSTRLQTRIIMWDADRADRLYSDAVLSERGAVAGTYFSGNTASVGTTKRRWAGARNASASIEEVFDPTLPTKQVPVDGSLVSSNQTKNRYSFSFFYTISNELGESAASQVTTIKTQRPWTSWQWLNPSGANTDDPRLCHDQITVTIPAEVFTNAVDSHATKWTAYYFYQGPNDAPSVTAMRFAEIDLSNDPEHGQHGYARLTPQMVKIGIGDPLVPSKTTLVNASDPRKGSQGLVAADRLIMVGNPADPARISWSSGAPGDYHNFSTLLGGGTKQLTSGNLYTTATVKLWQNPQSVDTLTILNAGDDGRSNAYYMSPANITSLSESISVMGFEEVSATQGTVSPYGAEVVNNALYRPLYFGLYKSTANNYNISTKPVSDSIENVWRRLQSMHRIVSAQLENRIYFLVHNIHGQTLEKNCRGNEVWILDVQTTTPTWSRWTVQGTSLRGMDIDDTVMMSIVRPDGIFVFNEDRYSDEGFDDSGSLQESNIKWYLETNIQGANRAHDAWANIQQVNPTVGNFRGQLYYGIRGKDVNGMHIRVKKILLSRNPPPHSMKDEDSDGFSDSLAKPKLRKTQREDYLLIRKIMKEWVFFAGSINESSSDSSSSSSSSSFPSSFWEYDPNDDSYHHSSDGSDDESDDDSDDSDSSARFSGGQITSVQYRYTPATVNVGYEYGSVETFEYHDIYSSSATTDSGTPKPYVDMSRA